MQITVTYSQTVAVDVESTDSVDIMLEKIRKTVDQQHYPEYYQGRKYLEFIIDECPEKPELIDEMLD